MADTAGNNGNDFELIVGINPKVSLERVQEGLTHLIGEINKDPKNKVTINVKLNEKKIKQVDALAAALSKFAAANKDCGDGGLIASLSSIDIRKISNAAGKFDALAAGIDKVTKAAKAAGQETRDMLAQVEGVFSSMSASRGGGSGGSRGKASSSVLRQLTNAYSSMLKLRDSNKNANVNNSITWKNFAGEQGVIENVRNALRSYYDTEGSVIDKTAALNASLEQSFGEFTNISQIIEILRQSMSSFKVEMEDTGNKGTVSFKRLCDTMTQAQNLLNNNSSMKNAGAFPELYSALKALNNIYSQVLGNAQYFNNADNANNATRAIEAATTAMSKCKFEISQTVERQKALTLGSQEYLAAIKKLTALSTKITQMQENWTKAKNGTSKSDYASLQTYASRVEGLRSRLSGGDFESKDFEREFSAINSEVSKVETSIKSAGENTKTWYERISALSSKFGTWFGITQVIMKGIRSIRQMIDNVIALGDSMAQLKIVTSATDAQMTKFLSEATGLAKDLGKSITDVLSSIETFSRLGYNLEDSSELAKYANILSNIASIDVDTATTGLTSIIKGYGMDVSETEHIADVLVEVGQKYAISAEELMAAFQRGGAALASTSTDFEQSAALFAATNASLQNAESTGTLWKTVSARIRGAKSELEELGEDTESLADGLSKYRGEILALSGVDIMVDDDTYKNMYQIFTELAAAWDNMRSDEAKSRIAEILGGTRQLSGIMSTINNISDAMGAYDDAINSAGTATKANDIYMETITAHLNQAKAAFQSFSDAMLNSDFLKFIVDRGTDILNFFDKWADTLGSLSVIGAGAGVFAAFKNVGRDKTYSLIDLNMPTTTSVLLDTKVFLPSRMKYISVK